MHIGLIGGIGVAATVVYYQRLTAAVSAQRPGPFDLTIVHASAEELLRNNLADNRHEQAEIYAHLINRLKGAGADCVAITSLGGHFCYDETVDLSCLPLVSAVKPLDSYFASQGFSKVGLLGTRVVMQTQLYGQLARTQAVAPVDTLEDVVRTYQTMALAGHVTEDQRIFFLSEGRKLVEEQGADAVVLAGTDLNLAYGGQTLEFPVVDALDVHVDLLARLATGQQSLDHVSD